MKLINTRGKPDYILLGAVILLALIGLLFIYSASYYMAERDFSDKFYYFTKQAVGFVVGVAAMLLASRLNLNLLKKLSLPLLAVSLVLLGLVFVPGLGIENYGAKRWVGFGGFSFQPSEIAKFAFVFFAATYMSREKTDMTRISHTLPVLGSGVAVCLLIILEPNMSITMCVGLVMLIMLFIGGMKPKWFVFLLVAAAVAVPVMILVEPYRLKRLLAFIDPWASPKDEGYQLIQSLYALGSGGWFGVGLFNSRQKYSFLPFAESDFVFSVIGEETGLVGCPVPHAAVFACDLQRSKNQSQRRGQIRLSAVRRNRFDNCRTVGDKFSRGNGQHTSHGIAAALYQLRRHVARYVHVCRRSASQCFEKRGDAVRLTFINGLP